MVIILINSIYYLFILAVARRLDFCFGFLTLNPTILAGEAYIRAKPTFYEA
jgi:hypothetical protein